MFLTSVFILSGLALALLVWFKHLEEKTRREFLILNLISRGDIKARELHQEVLRIYAEKRDQLEFFIKKQLPLHSKSMLNKSQAFLQHKTDKYLELLRDSKLLKKSDGISEFFKNVSSVEKGNGAIQEYPLEDRELGTKREE